MRVLAEKEIQLNVFPEYDFILFAAEARVVSEFAGFFFSPLLLSNVLCALASSETSNVFTVVLYHAEKSDCNIRWFHAFEVPLCSP